MAESGFALDDQLLPGGKRLTGRYGVWLGREYCLGAIDRQRGRVPIYFYGPEPAGMGFERDGKHPEQRWPWWSRWIPLNEVEAAYRISSKGLWRDADFYLHALNSKGDVNIEGPSQQYGEQKPINWWLNLPGFEPSDFRRAEGWVPLGEVTNIREEVIEMKL